MAINAGVWIDHQQAIVVLMTDTGEEIRRIQSNADKPFASGGGPGPNQADRPQHFMTESTQERKFMNQLSTFYDEVLNGLSHVDSVLILGPGEAKGEFHKRLKSQNFPGHVTELQTADKLTDRQLAARVRQQFGLVPG